LPEPLAQESDSPMNLFLVYSFHGVSLIHSHRQVAFGSPKLQQEFLIFFKEDIQESQQIHCSRSAPGAFTPVQHGIGSRARIWEVRKKTGKTRSELIGLG
jgi:hypothetical protein